MNNKTQKALIVIGLLIAAELAASQPQITGSSFSNNTQETHNETIKNLIDYDSSSSNVDPRDTDSKKQVDNWILHQSLIQVLNAYPERAVPNMDHAGDSQKEVMKSQEELIATFTEALQKHYGPLTEEQVKQHKKELKKILNQLNPSNAGSSLSFFDIATKLVEEQINQKSSVKNANIEIIRALNLKEHDTTQATYLPSTLASPRRASSVEIRDNTPRSESAFFNKKQDVIDNYDTSSSRRNSYSSFSRVPNFHSQPGEQAKSYFSDGGAHVYKPKPKRGQTPEPQKTQPNSQGSLTNIGLGGLIATMVLLQIQNNRLVKLVTTKKDQEDKPKSKKPQNS